MCRRPGLGAYCAAVGLINRFCTRLCQVRPRACATTVRASGCRCVAPLGRSVATFGPRRRLPTCLLWHVRRRWFSHRCTDSRPAAALSHRNVASLHAIIAVTSHGRRRLPPHCRPRMVFIAPPGSSSPHSSTTAASTQVPCMASPGCCRSRRLPHRLSRHLA
jgi:hypothetical protein